MQNHDNNNMCSKITIYIYICLPNASVTDDSFIQIIIFTRRTKAGIGCLWTWRFTAYVYYIIQYVRLKFSNKFIL